MVKFNYKKYDCGDKLMSTEKDRYLIGLDLGSGSVGWAVTSLDYKLVKKQGKNLWGVRLFDQAKSAAERRQFRRSRRTISKRNWRLMLLKQELKEFVMEEDQNFFTKLKNGMLKPANDEKLLFTGRFNDIHYFREFPTIYHLRQKLQEKNSCISYHERGLYGRFLFLAINDILKNRGHFLSTSQYEVKPEGLTINTIRLKVQDLISNINEELGYHHLDEGIVTGMFNDYMSSNTKNTRSLDKNTLLFKLLIGGYKVNVSKLFDLESDEKLELCFDDENWNEQKTNQTNIDCLLDDAFSIYSNIKVFKFLGKSKSYSEAKISLFQKHKDQLALLKRDISRIDGALDTKHYHHLFLDANEEGKDKDASYTHYVGKAIVGSKKIRVKKKSNYQNLMKKLNSIKQEYHNKTGLDDVLRDSEQDNYLAIPNNKENRLIPYQLHFSELKNILQTFIEVMKYTGNYHHDISIKVQRIEKLLTFKVPYFVGPLSNLNNRSLDPNYWVVKTQESHITPFNFDEIVDKRATNKAFVSKMLRNCTYLDSESCLQKGTIAYQTYIFYNTINKIKVNDTFLSPNQKQLLFNYVAKGRKITRAKLLSLLGTSSDAVLSGLAKDTDKALDLSLSAIKTYTSIFPDKKDNPFYKRFFDDVINRIALIDKDEEDLRRLTIEDVLKESKLVNISSNQIEALLKFKENKWGNLSSRFLCDMQFVNPRSNTGEVKSMLEWLQETNFNLMEILYDEEGYNLKIIDEENGVVDNFNKEDSINAYLKRKYVSPQAKRTIVQASKIVDEIVSIMGKLPEKIAIEFTRDKDKNPKMKDSRYAQLDQIYKTLKMDRVLLEQLHRLEKDQTRLKSKKLYLYFLQCGKDLYTGKPIDFDILFTSNSIYDIDHIYPQSRVKDDSLDNMVLTETIINGDKGNVYPLPEDIRIKQLDLWLTLKKHKLLSAKKFERLTRATSLSEEELLDFVNRQKTTLDWMNREVASIFSRKYGDNRSSFIIFSKSRHISDFRNNIGLLKLRELNNLHHAHDAYLNAVVGDTIQNHQFVVVDRGIKSNNVEKIVLHKLKDKIDYIRSIMGFYDPLITKKPSVYSTGSFWDQQIIKKKPGLIPVKKNMDTSILGGYNKPATAFFSIVKTKAGKLKIIAVPIYVCGQLFKDNMLELDKLNDYLIQLGYMEAIYPMIPIGTKMEVDKIPFRIAGKTGSQIIFHNIQELILSREDSDYLRLVFKEFERMKSNRTNTDLFPQSLFDREINFESNKRVFQSIRDRIAKNAKKYSPNTLSRLFNEQIDYDNYFSKLNLVDQVKLIKTIVTNLLSANTSNQGKLFGVNYIDYSVSSNVKYSLSIVKESITGFYQKRVDVSHV